jgi:membrane protease YdiL (CAAX protease family)
MSERIWVWQKRLAANPAVRTLLPGIAAIFSYFVIARVLPAPYSFKSLMKVILFLGIPAICLHIEQVGCKRELERLFRTKKREKRILLRILLVGSAIIVAANLLAKPLIASFGIAGIMAEIKARAHTDARAFFGAMVHIPLVNALVEELFFRGFLFMHVFQQGYPRTAMLGSSILFSLYHLAMFRGWFPWPILIVILGALFLAGILLNQLLLTWQRITIGWLLHGLANLAVLLLAWRVF